MSHYRSLFMFLFTISLLCACQPQQTSFEQITPGQVREQVLVQLGPPDETQLLVKQSMYIWGQEEEWWDNIEMGTQFVVWSYRVPGGRYQVYFLRGTDTVSQTAFVDDNIVYETQ